MGKRLERDENGRLPLSPRQKTLYEQIRRTLEDRWVDWQDIENLFREDDPSYRHRIDQITHRGWLEKRVFKSEKTGFQRSHYRVPEPLITSYCAECDTRFIAKGEYLCPDCQSR